MLLKKRAIFTSKRKNFPANIYLFKVNIRNFQSNVWNLFKVDNKGTRTTSALVVGLLRIKVIC